LFLGLVCYIIIIFIKYREIVFCMAKYGIEITSPGEDELKEILNLEHVGAFIDKYNLFQGIYLTNTDPTKKNFHISRKLKLGSKRGLPGLLWKGKIVPSGESNNLDSEIVEIYFRISDKEVIKGSIRDCGVIPKQYNLNMRI